MKFTLRWKVLGLVILSVVTITTVISIVTIRNIVSRGNERIAAYREVLLSERKHQIQGYVEMAIKIVQKSPFQQARAVLAAARYGEHGYIWINDFNNVMVVHPDPRLEGKDQSDLKDPNGVYILREITKTCKDKGEGFIEYMWKMPGDETLKPKISFAKSIPGTKWIAGTGVYIDDINTQVAKEKSRIDAELSSTVSQFVVLALTVTFLLLIFAHFIVKRYITGPLETISNTIKNFNNDLSITIPVTTEDEVGTLARWLNEHFSSLRTIIHLVSEVTERLHAQAGTIVSAVNQQTDFTSHLSSSVVEISSTMEEFSSTASQIAQHSQGVVDRADKSLEDTKHGAAEVETLTMKIVDLNGNIRTNLEEIVKLGKKSKEINKIMEIINNIANQTKLIAFNAALEAASAGEAGKRFGVVAVEIRRLADSVVSSTGEIESKITEILDAVNRLVMSSEKSSQLIQEGQEYATHTVEMLMEGIESVDETSSAARQISLSTKQQQIASSQVVIALKDIEKGVQSANDSAFKSHAIVAELTDLSEQLRSLVLTFKHEKDPAGPHGAVLELG
ncbi:methyl-accepting chemotaxis protein [Geomesophilobacter sediminis]|uniref:Methyl-accepting chemotaxis protein n=1 Tax=Geomesophilobacter sediminis TaxID=2798584 RepID=A0A8J7M1W8_9BACT|nr:methyl-accepting chemotaxis protein [Geomesophilobacter sediminis]MBJ6727137.1 methyl-accepting chemotaxis protein [Geomesophilobacter sediminis]